MDTATRPSAAARAGRADPLGFLADEVADLKRQNLFRPLRVMTSQQGPEIDLDGRRVINLSSNDYLGLTHHPRMKEAALRAVRDYGAGSGAVRSIIGTMGLHEALESELAEFKHTEAVLTFQSGFTANTGVIPTITGEAGPDRVRLAQPRLDHRRDAALEGAPQGLPAQGRRGPAGDPARGGRAWPRRRLGAVPADPRRDRRRVLDGRRHRAAARDRRGGRGVRQRRGLRRRRPFVGRARQGRPRQRQPLRARRPGRDPGRDAVQGRRRARRLRRRARRPCATSSSSARGRSSSRRRTRRPSPRPAARRSGSCRTSRS